MEVLYKAERRRIEEKEREGEETTTIIHCGPVSGMLIV